MKKVLSILLVMTMVFVLFTGCSQKPNNEQADGNVSNDESNTLVMYTNAEFAPFEYFEGEKIVGVDADISEQIAKDLGKEVVIQHIDFDSLIPSLVDRKSVV